MKAYAAYKKWWIECHAPSLIPSLYWGETPEHAFKQHIDDIGLYNLMETLVLWYDDSRTD